MTAVGPFGFNILRTILHNVKCFTLAGTNKKKWWYVLWLETIAETKWSLCTFDCGGTSAIVFSC